MAWEGLGAAAGGWALNHQETLDCSLQQQDTCLPGGNPTLWQSRQGVGTGELLLQAQMSGNRLCKTRAATWSGEKGASARAAGDYLEEASQKVLGCSPIDSWRSEGHALELAKCFSSVSSHKVGMRPAFLQPEMAGLGKTKGIAPYSEVQDILINPSDDIKKWAFSDGPIFLFVFQCLPPSNKEGLQIYSVKFLQG